jgi:hypothetical protein
MAASKKKAAAKSQEVAEAPESSMVVAGERPGSGAGRGSENVTAQDLTIPRVDVLQALSPQIKKNDPEYIEGAEQGDIFNTVTGDLYGGQIYFIPCYYRKEWVIWKLRKEGGGLVAVCDTQVEAAETMKQMGLDESKHEVVDTAQHFGLVVRDDGQVDEAVLSLSKTKMKVSRRINTMARMAGGDTFESIYKIESVEDSNDQGDFWNLKVSRLGWASEELYQRAEKLYDAVAEGRKDVAREEAEE